MDFNKVLMVIVAAGFMAWAGVVYNASDKVDLLLHSQERMQRDFENHERRGWHEEMGVRVSGLEAKFAVIERDLSKANEKLDRLVYSMNGPTQ